MFGKILFSGLWGNPWLLLLLLLLFWFLGVDESGIVNMDNLLSFFYLFIF